MLKVKITGSLKNELKAAGDRAVANESKRLLEKVRAATPIDTGNARQGWHLHGNALVNNVEYVNRLNEGHSRQAPSRFIEQTLLKEPGVTPNGVIVTNTR